MIRSKHPHEKLRRQIALFNAFMALGVSLVAINEMELWAFAVSFSVAYGVGIFTYWSATRAQSSTSEG